VDSSESNQESEESDPDSDESDVSWDFSMQGLPASKLKELSNERKKKKREEKRTQSETESEDSSSSSEDESQYAKFRKQLKQERADFLAQLDREFGGGINSG